jgi:uncharacterized membrane protein
MSKITFKQIVSRLKNRYVLTGIVSGILLILVNAGLIDTHMSDNITKAVNTLLSIGVGLGIVSNADSNITK